MSNNKTTTALVVPAVDLRAHQSFPAATPSLALGKYTFVYGPNGTGKSTLLRELKSQSKAQNAGFEVRSFDQSFVRNLLNPDFAFEGVLRVIDAPPEVSTRIEELTDPEGPIANAREQLTRFTNTLKQNGNTVDEAKQRFLDECWKGKQNVPPELRELGLKNGYNSKAKLADAVEREFKDKEEPDFSSANTFAELSKQLSELKKSAGDPTKPLLPLPAPFKLDAETEVLLASELRPNSENPLSHLIETLGLSDWVRTGLEHFGNSEPDCPFCQQSIDPELAEQLRNLFDSSYEQAEIQIRRSANATHTKISELQNFKASLNEYRSAEARDLLKAIEDHETYLSGLEYKLRQKLQSMSEVVSLDDMELPDKLNDKYKKAKTIVDQAIKDEANQEESESRIGEAVFKRFLVEYGYPAWKGYSSAIVAPVKAITNVQQKLKESDDRLQELLDELSTLQENVTSPKHVMEEVNKTLASLGFANFSLVPFGDEDSKYRAARADGVAAGPTLSEGEKTLVSFLYFYHRLRVDAYAKDNDTPLVAVFDDPITSLDSGTLFAVSLLCREILEICQKDDNRLEQVIFLTHNAYFFQELTFTQRGKTPPLGRKYYTFRKLENGSTEAKAHEKTPISSAYEQLWDELRDARDRGTMGVTTQNTMRRILETYFTGIGGFEADIMSKFPEDEALPARSLMAWVNDGSHNIPWNADYSPTAADAEFYHQVFKRIFEVQGQLGHYERMMR